MAPLVLISDLSDQPDTRSMSLEDVILVKEVRRILRAISPNAEAMMWLWAENVSWSQIGREFGISRDKARRTVMAARKVILAMDGDPPAKPMAVAA